MTGAALERPAPDPLTSMIPILLPTSCCPAPYALVIAGILACAPATSGDAARSDPDLASMLSIFACLAASERMPAQEQLRSRLPWGRRAGQAAATVKPVSLRTP
jgi:hypothetical protein